MSRLAGTLFLGVLLGLVVGVTAQEQKTEAQQMPPMGPPEQMKEMAALEGTWDAVMKYKMDPSQEKWDESEGTCTFKYILGGCAMQSVYNSQMMGMPFEGISIHTYDRETEQWQVSWLDNMAARQSMYQGNMTEDRIVLTGEDLWKGLKYLSRITTYNMTDTSYDWMMEMSTDDGKTWSTTMMATYTKRE